MSKIRCPNCHTEYVQSRKFCGECGTRLVVVCRLCGHENLARDKFCGECGEHLETIGGIEKALLKIESERKNVTVLFSDLSGYTRLAEKLDPEDVREITNRIFSEITRIVDRYEGFVERVIGDEVLVYFGVPKSYEDHAVRAILAAREIHIIVKALSLELREKTGGQTLRMHTGINSGLVVTGETDVSKGKDGFAGQTINIASRVTKAAGPGEILVGPATYRETKEYFIFETLPPRSFKGFNEPIRIYRVTDIRNKATKFDVKIKQQLTPLAGRRRELDFLLEYFEQSWVVQSSVVSIVSQPGGGKSRLWYEFKKTLTNHYVTIREGKCFSYHISTAYYPILSILKSYFDIRERDRDKEIKNKIKLGLKTIGLDESTTVPYLYNIFSLKNAGIQKMLPNPEKIKDRIVDVLLQFIIKDSKTHPLIFAVEDLHWVDKSSEEVIIEVLKLVPVKNVLFLFTQRTEYIPPWENTSFYYQITLNPLTYYESMIMVNSILGEDRMEANLEHLILEKTKGVPFFIEEFIQSLLDRKNIELKEGKYFLVKKSKNVIAPSSIQDVIATRLDSLPPKTKGLLQKCSVAGLEFSHGVIKPLSGLSEEDLQMHLSVLKASQLLYERRSTSQSRYIFRHAITQEVAYESMLVSKRKQIHELVGNAIEKCYHLKIDQFYELLAYHYSQSANREKAYQYLMSAGIKATSSYTNWEAFHFFKSAIGIIDEMPVENESIRNKIKALTLAFVPIVRLGYPEDSLKILMEGARLSKKLMDEKSLAKFYDLIGNYYTVKGGAPLLGIKYSEKCFAVAEKIHDFEIIARVTRGLCGSYIVVGEPLKSIKLTEKAIKMLKNEKIHRDYSGVESDVIPVLYALNGYCQGLLGNFTEGKQLFEKAIHLSRDAANLYDLAYIHGLCGYLYLFIGDDEKAVEQLNQCIRYCEEGKVIMWLGLAWTGLGVGYFFKGDLALSQKYIAKGIKIQEESQIHYYMSFHHFAMGLVSYDLRDMKNAGRCFEKALGFSKKYAEKWIEGLSKIYLGATLSKTDRYPLEKFEASILEGIKILVERKITPWSSVGYLVLGKFYAENRLPEKALKNLTTAECMFKEMGIHFWLSRTQQALQQL